MSQAWSDPIPYDLSRTHCRASVPKRFAMRVPEAPGTYVICRIGQPNVCEGVLDIGEAGLRPDSTPRGLRGRLATTVAHSASQKIAADIDDGGLPNELRVVWVRRQAKEDAKELQDALITLFSQECGRQPRYNTKLEQHAESEAYGTVYAALKARIGCVSRRPTTRCS